VTGSGGHHSQINVTPLVDVVLVLLIIFMVIVPIARRGYDLDVPVQAGPAEPVPASELEQIVLDIAEDDCPTAGVLPDAGFPPGCRVRLGGLEVDALELAVTAERIFTARPGDDRVLFLSAEDDLEYELVMRVVDAARSRVPDLRIGLVAATSPSSTLVSQIAPTGALQGE